MDMEVSQIITRLDGLIARHDEMLKDHEKRTRNLEKWLYLCIGGGSLLYGIFEHLSHLKI